MTGLKEMTLMEQQPSAVAVSEPPAVNIAAMFERLAANPDIPVDKLQALMDMQRSVLADRAKASFAASFAAMQDDLPVIVERAKGHNDKKYAPLEDIVEVVRPILSKHGFSLNHRTEWPGNGVVRIVGVLTHRDGHERTSEFITGADKSGNKNEVQAYGSSMSYGRRYTTTDLLCIVTRGEDDDAQKAGRRRAPEGFEDWRDALVQKAAEGLPALQAMWKVANETPDLKVYAKYLTETEPATWNRLKTQASRSGAK